MPKNNDPINSLPEYEIRTMEDDINKLEGGPTDKKPVKLELPPPPPTHPSNLERPKIQEIPKIPSSPAPLPPKPTPIKPLPSPIDISPPETLPIITKIEESKIQKAPLPSMEEFISKAPTPPKVETPTIMEEFNTIEKIVEKKGSNPPKADQPRAEKPKKIISPEARRQRTKRVLIILVIVLVIIALGLFFYWQGVKPEPLPLPLPDNGIKVPNSLIPVDETKILEIGNNISLENLLRDESMINQQPGTIKRIVPVKNEKEILLLNELLKELKIAVYPYILSELNDNYNLIIYGQDTNRTIGLIIQTNNSNNIKEQLKYWEATMADDLKNLFLFKKPGNPTTKFFKDNAYNNIAIRYINFPNPDLTIDYAVSGNLFILSTSQESIYNIIDRLQ